MATEFEVKVLDIDLPAVEARLRQVATFSHSLTFHDFFYENAHTKANGIDVRLRDAEGQCTLTVKSAYQGGYGRKSREEIEVSLASMAEGKALLRLVGFTVALERTLRKDFYTIGTVSAEIVFNELFDPYLEIEGTLPEVIGVCGLLGIPDSEIYIGGEPYVRHEADG